jgi:hypothetical protein
MCDFLKLSSETFLILRIIHRYIVILYIGLHVKYTSFSSHIILYIGLRVQYMSFSSHINQLHLPRQIFEKSSSINFRENMSSGSRTVVPCRRANMTKLTVAFRNAAKAPKNKKPTTSREKSNWFSLLWSTQFCLRAACIMLGLDPCFSPRPSKRATGRAYQRLRLFIRQTKDWRWQLI